MSHTTMSHTWNILMVKIHIKIINIKNMLINKKVFYYILKYIIKETS